MSDLVKLTLSADRRIVQKAKRLARQRHTSVSAMFTQFVESAVDVSAPEAAIGPLTLAASGLFSVPQGKSDRQLLEDALLEKYELKP